MSITSPGMSISFWGENSCWISSIGKIGARSSGASGARVCGFSGGASGSGSDGSTLTQIEGIWLSASRNLECSCMGNAYLTTSQEAVSDWLSALSSADEADGCWLMAD